MQTKLMILCLEEDIVAVGAGAAGTHTIPGTVGPRTSDLGPTISFVDAYYLLPVPESEPIR